MFETLKVTVAVEITEITSLVAGSKGPELYAAVTDHLFSFERELGGGSGDVAPRQADLLTRIPLSPPVARPARASPSSPPPAALARRPWDERNALRGAAVPRTRADGSAS